MLKWINQKENKYVCSKCDKFLTVEFGKTRLDMCIVHVYLIQGKINFSDLWNGKPDSPMKPKGKYVCRECDEFSTNEKTRLDGHYLGAHF